MGEDNIPLAMGRIEGNSLYHRFMFDAVQNDWAKHLQIPDRRFLHAGNSHAHHFGSVKLWQSEDETTFKILVGALQSITQDSANRLNHAVAIGTVAHPVYLNFTSKISLAQAAQEVDPTFRGLPWTGDAFRAAAYTRSDNYCTVEPVWGGDNHQDEPANHILMLNYDLDHLDIVVGVTPAQSPTFYGRTVATMKSCAKLDAEHVRVAIKHAVEQYLAPGTSSWEWKNPLDPEEFHSVVILGEATQADITFLSSIVEEVLPDHHHTLQFEQPEFRAALGASCADYVLDTYLPESEKLQVVLPRNEL
ncbi:hypothetical protein LTR84_007154 [Exophiala bonariae]|uniref:Uncharacterized protein n=1 Tax=Exophiala bonariae TaxID=1690606 RepID=A0AAV9MYM0_9EURO|nr:hypothetical protein LTR84_007154 [Exophiala bonariae]